VRARAVVLALAHLQLLCNKSFCTQTFSRCPGQWCGKLLAPAKHTMLNALDIARFGPIESLYTAAPRTLNKVLSIVGDWSVRRAFNQLGIHPGDHVRVVCKAPFGGPLVIEDRGTRVAISKQLAERVKVEMLS
jgi:Fe2+ transport system protein FeoA